jgi:NTE family protein
VFEAELPRAFRFMTRGLGTREARNNDMLSLVMFQADAVKRLIAMGGGRREARLPDIRRFLERAVGGTEVPPYDPPDRRN